LNTASFKSLCGPNATDKSRTCRMAAFARDHHGERGRERARPRVADAQPPGCAYRFAACMARPRAWLGHVVGGDAHTIAEIVAYARPERVRQRSPRTLEPRYAAIREADLNRRVGTVIRWRDVAHSGKSSRPGSCSARSGRVVSLPRRHGRTLARMRSLTGGTWMKLHDVAAIAAWFPFAVLATGCSTTVTTSTNAAPAEATPSGCTQDDGVTCEASGEGWTCPAGNNPEMDNPLSCSVPQADGANDDFCCIPWTTTSSTCVPQDSSTFDDDTTSSFVCAFGSYGYQCDSGDDPTSLDSSLTCSSGVQDPDMVHEDFCCY